MSYLAFEDRGLSPSGKTKRWVVRSSQGEGVILGWVEWHAPWRKYTFSPLDQVIFDASCLRDVAEFLDAEMAKR